MRDRLIMTRSDGLSGYLAEVFLFPEASNSAGLRQPSRGVQPGPVVPPHVFDGPARLGAARVTQG